MKQLALFTIALVAACGGSDDKDKDVALEVAFPDAPDTSEVSESYSFVTLCDGFARACCNVQRCVEPGAAPDDACYQATRGYCEDAVQAPIASHITPGEVHYSDSAAGECVAYYVNGGCGDSTNFETPPAACDTVFEGQGGDGAACAFDALCAPGFFCKPIADACPGTCAPRLAAGASCNGVDALCRSDLICTNDNGGTCVAPSVASGAACLITRQCPSAEYCDTTSGTCVADLAVGAACPNGNECGAGLTCNFANEPPACERVPLEGETCERFCAFPFLCDQGEHKCVAAPSEPGDACVDATSPCGYHQLECNAATNKCEVLGGEGSACGGPDGDLGCAFSYCDGDFLAAGTCQPLKGLGDACGGFGECGDYLTCRDGTCQMRAHACRGVSSLRCF